MTSEVCSLALLEGEPGTGGELFTLINIGHGGMRFQASRSVGEGDIHRFLIDLAALPDRVTVAAKIRWVQPLAPGRWDVGAVFLESSRGWLGPPASNSE